MTPEGEKRRAVEEIRSYLAAQRKDRPSVAFGADLSPKGRATLAQILGAANKVFVREGHAGLSMRKVADEAGLAVGNISYYFPSKHALIEATLREALADYIEQHLDQFEENDAPLQILLNVVEFYVANGRKTHGLFFQMWGYAGSDPAAKALVRELYRPIGRFIFYLVRAVRPELDHAGARTIVLQLFSLEEGVKLFIGMGPDDDRALVTAESHIRALAERIVAG